MKYLILLVLSISLPKNSLNNSLGARPIAPMPRGTSRDLIPRPVNSLADCVPKPTTESTRANRSGKLQIGGRSNAPHVRQETKTKAILARPHLPDRRVDTKARRVPSVCRDRNF